MIYIVEMREDDPHPLPLPANLANRVLHEPEMCRQTLDPFPRYASPVSTELVEYDTRHDKAQPLPSTDSAGVYADVVKPGTIRRGDAVQCLD